VGAGISAFKRRQSRDLVSRATELRPPSAVVSEQRSHLDGLADATSVRLDVLLALELLEDLLVVLV
jgi:hypothetical protein